MRRGMLELCLIIILVIGIHAKRILRNNSINDRISPANTSSSVLSVKEKDSVIIVSNKGHFGMVLQPGDWKLIFATNEINTPPAMSLLQATQ